MQHVQPRPSLPGGTKALRHMGTAGSALALVILGASVLLRLSTEWDASGSPVSTLPASVENVVRLTHRLTASGVGLLALAATLLCWMRRATLPQALRPTAGIVAATVLLALIGPLTPGYRYVTVTMANVVGGTVLLMSCWWLRECMAKLASPISNKNPWIRVTLLAFLTHIASGAAASALEMRGLHWVAYLHIGSAVVFLFAAAEILWNRSIPRPFNPWTQTTTMLLLLQIAIGVLLLWMGRQTVWLGVIHAMVSQLMAVGLVSVAIRNPPPAP